MLIVPLISYAIVVTALLAYCYMVLMNERASNQIWLPDEGYNSPSTKKSELRTRGPLYRHGELLALEPLQDLQKTTLGKPIRFGDLEVTPLRVELRKVYITTGVNRPELAPEDSLVLYLELKNVSSDVQFCPLDPFFDREYKPTVSKSGIPYTYLEVGGKKLFGGPAIYTENTKETLDVKPVDPSVQPPGMGDIMPQRATKLLNPGEKMTSFVCTNPDHHAAEVLKDYNGPLLYRVRVRNGLTPMRGKEVPTTVVVGVEFSPDKIVKVATP
jgi:hypothetical protein